ncbi:MAG TPA: TetR/AcrR family transcriptional regulator [Acidimicrobiales bacterium]|jgi:AcrR family transcriptional regulator|nr:TetR/AcrR family transcriptional regulator [Acidimicrobiales bacterium]
MEDGEQVPVGRRERKKAATRARLIECAYRLIDQRGYDATSLTDITEAADVSARTFYLYFDSKADVALAGFFEWIDALMAAMAARPMDEPPDRMLAESMRQLFEAGYTSGNMIDDAKGRPMIPVVHALLLAEDSPEVAGGVYRTMMRATDRFSALFADRLGYPPGTVEPELLAAGIVGAFVGSQRAFAALAGAGRNPGPIDQLTADCYARFGVGLAVMWEGRLSGDPIGGGR